MEKRSLEKSKSLLFFYRKFPNLLFVPNVCIINSEEPENITEKASLL